MLARREPGVLAPTSQMRAVRELEPPSIDEGFASVEQVAVRARAGAGATRPGVFVAAAALQARLGARARRGRSDAPHLVFDWSPDGTADALAPRVARLAAEVAGPVESALCPHAAGPPTCWCRPPLPGLPARVRAGARRRSGALDSRRRRPGAPDAGDDARRPLRRRLIALTS